MSFQFTLAQATELINLQNKLNSVINPDWAKAGYAWHRAAWTEAAELIESVGWKWWKKQTPDADNIKVELVDLWHFAIADLIEGFEGDLASTAEYLAARVITVDARTGEPLDLIEHFVAQAAEGFISIQILGQLCVKFGMTPDEVYAMYLVKNVLNTFRQANGYKTGTYIKDWNGAEDNVRAFDLAKILDETGELTGENLTEVLGQMYSTVVKEPVTA